MRRIDWSWAYWALFGLSVTTGLVLIVIAVWRVQQAYEFQALGRNVLVDALTLGLGALTMLLVSGWAVASRPSSRPADPDSIWD